MVVESAVVESGRTWFTSLARSAGELFNTENNGTSERPLMATAKPALMNQCLHE